MKYMLYISAVPSPPYNVELVTCMGHKADLDWRDGSDGGDPIKGYLVQYNTSDNPNYWNSNYEEIPISTPVPRTIDLSPWGTYSFRVLARNSIGYSEPSLPTKEPCPVPPGHPDRNPDKVGTKTDRKYKLVITWEVGVADSVTTKLVITWEVGVADSVTTKLVITWEIGITD